MTERRPFFNNDRRRFLRRSVIGIAAAFLVVGQGMSWLQSHYRIGIDEAPEPCLPWRVYLVKIDPAHRYQPGDYVSFVGTTALMGEKFHHQWIAKKVGAVAGDEIRIENDALFINGQPYATSMPLLSKLGLKSGAKDRVERVPEGKLFVIGTEPRAFDSRYWGFLDASQTIGPITPIF